MNDDLLINITNNKSITCPSEVYYSIIPCMIGICIILSYFFKFIIDYLINLLNKNEHLKSIGDKIDQFVFYDIEQFFN